MGKMKDLKIEVDEITSTLNLVVMYSEREKGWFLYDNARLHRRSPVFTNELDAYLWIRENVKLLDLEGIYGSSR